MASEGANHLVILFLISNCFCGFGFGVFLFALGVGNAVIEGTAATAYIVCLVVGLIITVLSMDGYIGAITHNKKKLGVYGSWMIILSILEIAHLATYKHNEQHNQDMLLKAFFVTMIFMIVFQLVSILLALTIACRIVSGKIAEKERQQQGLGAA